jgi:hypothetical protein
MAKPCVPDTAEAGRRPALVLSPAGWRSRKAKGRITPAQLAEVRAKIVALIG